MEQLDSWMAEEERFADPAFYGTARAGVRYQPKGVIGNIVPWNFPFDLSVGPLVEMLAAGNRVDHQAIRLHPGLRRAAQADDRRDVRRGPGRGVGRRADAGQGVPDLRWDHLLYTGSPAIGREIARAAAENLVPVTLELGGKCPAILAADSVDAASVRSVIGTKLVKNGQMCISVDYALVPRAQVDAFIDARRALRGRRAAGLRVIRRTAPASSPAAPGPDRGDGRRGRASGARVVSLGGEADPATRRLPLQLVIDPPRTCASCGRRCSARSCRSSRTTTSARRWPGSTRASGR